MSSKQAGCRLKAIDLMIEAVKDLKRQHRLMVWQEQMIVQVPYFKEEPSGKLVRVNRLGSIWLGWRRRRSGPAK